MSRFSKIDGVGFSLSKDRLTVVFLEGRVTDKDNRPYGVNIRIVGDKLHVVKHRGGMLGSKYKLTGNADAWSYQVMLKSVPGGDDLKARYPQGVSMMTMQQIRQFGDGKTAMFALPDPDETNPSVPKVLNGPKRATPRLQETHHGSNGTALVVPTPEQEEPKAFMLPSKTIGYPEEGLDIPTAISFLNAVKRSCGDCFEMTVKPDGQLKAAIFEEFE